MPLPADIQTVHVTGSYDAQDTDVVKGTVTFIHPGWMVSTVNDSIVPPKPQTVVLVDGSFSVDLIKDDEIITYQVIENFSNPIVRRTWYVDVYPADTTFDLADRSPASVVQMGQAYLTQGMLDIAAQAAADAADFLIDAEIVNGELILKSSDGVRQVNVGSVLGPQGVKGDKGDPGDMSPALTATWTGNVIIPTVTVASANTLIRSLSGNTTITSLANGTANLGYTISFVLRQAASGGPFTFTWPGNIEWANDASPPAMPTVASAELIVHLFWTGQAWRGMVGGVFFP